MATGSTDILVEGLVFPEGARWHAGTLWFSDMHAHTVLRLEPDGTTVAVAEVPEGPSGLGFLPDGRLLVVSMHDRRVLRRDPDGLHEHANLWELTPWHCNDMVVDGSGRAYVGNFGDGSAPPDPPHPTVLVCIEPSGAARIVASDLMFPNGIVATADGSALIVAETRSTPGRLTRFRIEPNGDLSNREVVCEFAAGELPDGLTLDGDGGIWVAMPFSGEVVRVTQNGEIDRRISIENPYSVAIGGADGGDLFVCTAPTWVPEAAKRLRGGAVHRIRIA